MRRSLAVLSASTLTIAASLPAQSAVRGRDSSRATYEVTRIVPSDAPEVLDVIQLLEGRVPGLILSPLITRIGGGRPDVIVRQDALVRGEIPLIVIDGVLADNGTMGLVTSDIVSIEVLRGAAAAAEYGARAGAGVIRITTRRPPGAGRLSVRVRNLTGSNDVATNYSPARATFLLTDGAGQRLCVNSPGASLCTATVDWSTEVLRVNNQLDSTATPASFPVGGPAAGPMLANLYQANLWPSRAFNPVRQVSRASVYNLAQLEADGALGAFRLSGGLSRLDEPGAMRYVAGYHRYAARFDAETELAPGLRAWWRTLASAALDSGRTNYETAMQTALAQPTSASLLLSDTLGRTFIRPSLLPGYVLNPAEMARRFRDESQLSRLNSAIGMQYDPTAWLTIAGNLGVDRASLTRSTLQDYSRIITVPPDLYLGTQDASSNAVAWELGATARWQPAAGLRATSQLRLQSDKLSEHSLWTFGPATGGATSNEQTINWRDGGTLAATTLTYLGRYTADMLVRRDDTARTSWRLGAAWHASDEPWWPLPSAISDAAFRIAAGSSGGVPNVNRLFEFGSPGDFNGLIAPGARRNETELGADLEVGRRVSLSVTHRASSGHVQAQVPIPSLAGFSFVWADIGIMSSSSWSVSASLPVLRSPDASWSWRVSYDRTRTSVERLDIAPYLYGLPFGVFNAYSGAPFGQLWGRKFVTDCAELPPLFQIQCGDAQAFQKNDDGFITWVGGNAAGVPFSWKDGIRRNLWGDALPTFQAPWGVPLKWGAPIVVRDSSCNLSPSPACGAAFVPLGEGLPSWTFSVGTTARWKRIAVSALLEGSVGRRVWNEARQVAFRNFTDPAEDQVGRAVETAKPIGYYWRAAPPDNGAGYGGLYDVLGPNNYFVESVSFARLRELALRYDVGPALGTRDVTIGVTGRNLLTFTPYKGLDPEVPVQAEFGYGLNASDAAAFPVLRSFAVSLSVAF